MAGIYGGGGDNFGKTPMRKDGYGRQWDTDEDIMGCHAGDSAGLNVSNPQEGMVYQWVRRSDSSMLSAKMKGGQIVMHGDSDGSAVKILNQLGISGHSEGATEQDSMVVFGDCVLMRYDEERFAASRMEEAQRSERQLRHASDDFLQGADANEMEASGGRQTRFARRDHSVQLQGSVEGEDEIWTPDMGLYEQS